MSDVRAILFSAAAVLGALCLGEVFLFWFETPGLTQMEVFLAKWPYHLMSAVFLAIAAWIGFGTRD